MDSLNPNALFLEESNGLRKYGLECWRVRGGGVQRDRGGSGTNGRANRSFGCVWKTQNSFQMNKQVEHRKGVSQRGHTFNWEEQENVVLGIHHTKICQYFPGMQILSGCFSSMNRQLSYCGVRHFSFGDSL